MGGEVKERVLQKDAVAYHHSQGFSPTSLTSSVTQE